MGDKAYEGLKELIEKKGRGYLQLEELRFASCSQDNVVFLEALDRVVSEHLIEEVKSASLVVVGQARVRMKWKVIPDSIDAGKLTWLHPLLMQNTYFLRHPKDVLAFRDELVLLGSWIEAGRHQESLTQRERSLEIFGDEKALDERKGLKTLLGRLGMDDGKLGIVSVPTTFELVLGTGYYRSCRPKRIIISENRDPWFRIASELSSGCTTVLGTEVDAVVYGCGNSILAHRGDDFISFLDAWSLMPVEILYWGDIDRAGIDIAAKLTALLEARAQGVSVMPFMPGYEAMLRWTESHNAPESADSREVDASAGLSWLFKRGKFTPSDEGMIQASIVRGLRIPQEAAALVSEQGI